MLFRTMIYFWYGDKAHSQMEICIECIYGLNIGIANDFECFIQWLSTEGVIVHCTKAVRPDCINRGTFVDNHSIKHERHFYSYSKTINMVYSPFLIFNWWILTLKWWAFRRPFGCSILRTHLYKRHLFANYVIALKRHRLCQWKI